VKNFRTIWKFLVPGFLQRGHGEIVQHVKGLMLDASLEAAYQTALLMLPSRCPSDALEKIGADRGIPRGFSEPEASYRERLRRWRWPRGHRVRGNASGLLEQIAAVFAGAGIFQTIDVRGTRYTQGAGAAERGVTWDWDGQALTPNWARFWIYIAPTGVKPWPVLTEDGGGWGPIENPDVCFDMKGVHPGQIAAVRTLCKVGRLSWVPAGRRAIYLVTDVNGEGFPEPDGTWNDWENRDSLYSYTPLHASIT
jgi:hypothetical protein